MQSRMSAPPMVGVPFFFWCVSGVSSRTLLCPCCCRRSRAMSRGPDEHPEQQRDDARRDDAEGRVAEEVEERAGLGVLEPARRAGSSTQ